MQQQMCNWFHFFFFVAGKNPQLLGRHTINILSDEMEFTYYIFSYPSSSDSKELTCNKGDLG